ncbi:TTL-domain-containing protein [Testicularia cyperi]|uniref:TTL-domain-containing protein n=1 Tax=Testicularia cyperi TaxID=1882483 RepID=A0A317XQ04_9BASI|nr:TTL-domain-containing protein [Testicularia cyperi]
MTGRAFVSFPGADYTHFAAARAAQNILAPRGWIIDQGDPEHATIGPSQSSQERKDGNETEEKQAPLDYDLYLADYDLLPFEHLLPSSLEHNDKGKGKQPQCSSYVIRKALIRKHYLASALHSYAVKTGGRAEIYTSCTPRTWHLEIQFADELEELLMDDLYDLGEVLEANGTARQEARHDDVRWFILKPGMADRGNGIRIFSTLEQLEEIFREFEPDSDDDDDGDDENEEDAERGNNVAIDSARQAYAGKDTSIMASQLRHFVIQEYVQSPLLVDPVVNRSSESIATRLASSLTLGSGDAPVMGPRKFHLRAYVVCVGGLSVYLHDDMLALFAPLPYTPPSTETMRDLRCHLTNTCLQEDGSMAVGDDGRPKEENVFLWQDLEGSRSLATGTGSIPAPLSKDQIDGVRVRAAKVIGATFEAAAKAGAIHWQLWPNAFEIFGVDLLVSCSPSTTTTISSSTPTATEQCDGLEVKLLEINAQPDFAQTGLRLSATIDGLFERTCEIAVLPFHGDVQATSLLDGWQVGESRRGTTLCFQEDLGRGF